MSSLLVQLKNNYSIEKKKFGEFAKFNENNFLKTGLLKNSIIKSIVEKRKKMVDTQINHIFNMGDADLRNSITRIKKNQYHITYKHIWSNEGNAVGTMGGKLNIYFYRNFFELPHNDTYNENSHSEIMMYAGCITIEGAIRSMLIHELGHVYFRRRNSNGKWVSILRNSHNRLWSDWVALKIIKYNNIVGQSCPELLIGFTIFKGFNNTYDNPNTELLEMLNGQYYKMLKPNGYFADPIMFPDVKNPFDW